MHFDYTMAAGSLLVSVIVGMTGMGGGALMTPMLTVFFGVPPLAAVSSDLVAAAVMKPVGGLVHLRHGTVNLPLVRWLCVGSVPSAFCGVLVARALGDGHAVQDVIAKAMGVALLVAAAGLAVRGYLAMADRAAQATDRSDSAGTGQDAGYTGPAANSRETDRSGAFGNDRPGVTGAGREADRRGAAGNGWETGNGREVGNSREVGDGQGIGDNRETSPDGSAVGGPAVGEPAVGEPAGRGSRAERRTAAPGSPASEKPPAVAVRPVPTVLVGIVGGLSVGMTSVGSGSLIIVTLLALYPALKANQLVGTDLLQAVPLVWAAALGHILFGDFTLEITAALLAGSIPGVIIGSLVSARAPGGLIRRVLAFVLLASALKMFGVGNAAMLWTLSAVAACAAVAWMLLRTTNGLPPLASLGRPKDG